MFHECLHRVWRRCKFKQDSMSSWTLPEQWKFWFEMENWAFSSFLLEPFCGKCRCVESFFFSSFHTRRLSFSACFIEHIEAMTLLTLTLFEHSSFRDLLLYLISRRMFSRNAKHSSCFDWIKNAEEWNILKAMLEEGEWEICFWGFMEFSKLSYCWVCAISR